MDLDGLFPKYFNIRRGCLPWALLSWAVQPWLIYNTASVFVAAMAALSVFLEPLTGIMMVDYFAIRDPKIEVSQLYTRSKRVLTGILAASTGVQLAHGLYASPLLCPA